MTQQNIEQHRRIQQLQQRLTVYTLAQLNDIAREMDIPLNRHMVKADVTDAIAQAQYAYETQMEREASNERPAVTLIGTLVLPLRPVANSRNLSTFLVLGPNVPNIYVTMSDITHRRMMDRVAQGNMQLHAPVSILGHYFESRATNPDGSRKAPGFHIKGIRPAAPIGINAGSTSSRRRR